MDEIPQNFASARNVFLFWAPSTSYRRASIGCSQNTLGCAAKVSLMLYIDLVIHVDEYHQLARVDKRSEVMLAIKITTAELLALNL